MPSRQEAHERAKVLAHETLDVLRAGAYVNERGETVDVSDAVSAAVAGTEHYASDHTFPAVPTAKGRYDGTIFRLRSDTSFAAARDLVRQNTGHVAVLNFASGRHPGGGFMRGAIAQEECLARSSGLYPCLARFEYMPDHMYQINRKLRGAERAAYTSCAFFSPQVPVMRGDDLAGNVFDKPFSCSVITMPAPNASVRSDHPSHDAAARERSNKLREEYRGLLADRIDRVLSIASEKGCDALVLGAFGCGAFGNDPNTVAAIFRDLLVGKYATCFREIHFAVYVSHRMLDADPNYVAFQNAFVSLLSSST